MWLRAFRRRGLASVYERSGSWYLQRHNRTRDGVWVESGAILLGLREPRADILEQACRAAIASSRRIPSQTFRGRVDEYTQLPHLADARSWRSFAERARCVTVHQDHHGVTVTPMRRERNHFTELLELAQRDPSNLGSAILAQMTRTITS